MSISNLSPNNSLELWMTKRKKIYLWIITILRRRKKSMEKILYIIIVTNMIKFIKKSCLIILDNQYYDQV